MKRHRAIRGIARICSIYSYGGTCWTRCERHHAQPDRVLREVVLIQEVVHVVAFRSDVALAQAADRTVHRFRVLAHAEVGVRHHQPDRHLRQRSIA